jgi:signal-transduction protein with cAMP-binding, CBS, and nucleotidyltransferase domain
MNPMDNLDKVEIFKGLDQSQITILKDCCAIKTFNEGVKIFGDQEAASFLWAVIKGNVDLRFDLPGRESAKDTTIATITEGKVFGWSSFVPPYKYRLSAYCSTNGCQLLEINRECLLKVFETHSLIGYRVMANLSIVIGTRFQQLQGEVAWSEGDKLLHQKDY